MKKIIYTLLIWSVFVGTAIGQVKVKDGSVQGSPVTPVSGALMELESIDGGFLVPKMTTDQRDAIAVTDLNDGMSIYNTDTGCFNFWNTESNAWLQLCGTPPPAVFSISDCNSVVASGQYIQGENLDASNNVLSIPVTVEKAGPYTVSGVTSNGYLFNTSGEFEEPGSFTLTIPGSGTPGVGYDEGELGDNLAISLNGKEVDCSIDIYVQKADVNFEIACSIPSPVVEGDYFIGIPLDNTNKMIFQVEVLNTGAWNIDTDTKNGISFSGSGVFTEKGVTKVELIGSGTPEASGKSTFQLVSNSENESSCSGIAVTTSPVEFTVDCDSVVINGTYQEDVVLESSNTIELPINVVATGTTTISTNSQEGVSFSSGEVTFTELGSQTITLTSNEDAFDTSGTKSFNVRNGVTTICSFEMEVIPQPVTYSINCSSVTVSGDYLPELPMSSSNTMSISVDVQYVGSYSMSTDAQNGVSFSASGTFTSTGFQTVMMQGTGTPVSGGAYDFTISTDSNVSGSESCTKEVIFQYRTMNILGIGSDNRYNAAISGYTPRTLIESTSNFSPSGKIKVQGFNFTNAGGNPSASQLRDYINNNNIDIIIIGYNYNPDSGENAVLEDFVKNKKGVLLAGIQDNSNVTDLIDRICGGNVSKTTGGGTLTNPMSNVDDPILNGPFGDVRGKKAGSDLNNSVYITNLPSTVSALATNESGNQVFMFKHNTLGFFFCGDSGFHTGDKGGNGSNDIWPARTSSTGTPVTKPYSGGTVYNSFFYANAIAWAIQYAQENLVEDYQVQ
ncbi:hypothetical protein JM658_16620 [Joostella atrarenae]|uniref:Uncharacterized protein n=1 Tax=Joostella atrarenae TaxID=679257 RepID=A0ABS9J7Q8_9FLAO|nr:hypothetical protein [Joostella atrarenae]MCF8716452.1 hypothetical protein [Joostella atrarenae]